MKTPPAWLHKQFRADFDMLAARAYPSASTTEALDLLALVAMSKNLWRAAVLRAGSQPNGHLTEAFRASMGYAEIMRTASDQLETLLKREGSTVQ